MKNLFYNHETSVIDNKVTIGNGTKIWHFSHIQSGAYIGENCSIGQNVYIGSNVIIGNSVKVQNNVSIYEGVELEDFVFCGPSITFTNIVLPRSEYPQKGSKFYLKTLVKKSASIGANATIVCGNTIGQYAMIGAGAVITKNIPDFSLVLGNPGRIVGWVNKKGENLDFDKNGLSFCGNYKLNNNKLIFLDKK
jgi:UDP-2-acetamido-3-amino-2,3-dideoxy-glucuronate N-acetyltransferase